MKQRQLQHAGIEVLEAGLATHYVASEKLPALEEALHELGPKARNPTEVGRTLQSIQVRRSNTPAASQSALLLCTLLLHHVSCSRPQIGVSLPILAWGAPHHGMDPSFLWRMLQGGVLSRGCAAGAATA